MNTFERMLLDYGKAALTEYGKAAVIAAFEPEKEWLRVRPEQVRAALRVLRKVPHDGLLEFGSPTGRDDFLDAARKCLQGLDHEELLVAFGTRRGSARNAGASLRRVHRTIGTRGNVPVTNNLRALIYEALERPGAEIVLVHNHPPNPLKTALGMAFGGWRPLPSDADRALAFSLLKQRGLQLLTSPRPASLKWFLVDEGGLGEFLLPSSAELLAFLRSLPKA